VRFFIDPDTGEPHIYAHGVEENEVEDVLFFQVRTGAEEVGRELRSDERVEAATFAWFISLIPTRRNSSS